MPAIIKAEEGDRSFPSDRLFGSRREIVDYGSGVYYFPVTEVAFARTLSAFIAEHPELELLAMTGSGTSGHGRDKGYFVVFRKKA